MPSYTSATWISMCLLFMSTALFSSTDGLDPLEPEGNITILWDVVQWTNDGYIALISIFNYQQYRHIEKPGWTLGWTWKGKEVIWDLWGGEATQQGDCSHIKKGKVPHSCSNSPRIVDLMPDVPYSMRIANCCRGGVLSSMVQNPQSSVASFRVQVGRAATSKDKLVAPTDFKFGSPGPGYSCSLPHTGGTTKYPARDGRRHTQALRTWRITCKYMETLANRSPKCCVSLSAFYDEAITPCPLCSCRCLRDPTSNPCLQSFPEKIENTSEVQVPAIKCTSHMCPVRIHWHLKSSYTDYWKAKVTITNYLSGWNYTDWNLVIQHPSSSNLAQVSAFNYTVLHNRDDSVMFWGEKKRNDWLLEGGARAMGSLQSEILLAKKRKGEFWLSGGWAFPRRVYFNGDECVLPAPDAYPRLPLENKVPLQIVYNWLFVISILMAIGFCRFLYYACTFQFKDRLRPHK